MVLIMFRYNDTWFRLIVNVVFGEKGRCFTTKKFICFFFLTVLSCSDLVSALECSQCTSATLASCESSPPLPTACKADQSAGANCMVARELNSKGEQLSFIRSCTLVRVGKGCVQRPNNTNVCYETCNIDACNHTNEVSVSVTAVIFLVIVHLASMYCKNK